MPTIAVATELDAPAALVWSAVKTPHAFVHVAGALLRYPPAERLDRPWEVGDHLEGWVLLGRLIPVSRHHLTIDRIDEEARVMVSDEAGGPVRRWRHELITTPIGEHRCRYEDRIEIEAGALTPLVLRVARLFYQYRQRRWRRLARLLAVTVDAAPDASSTAARTGATATELRRGGDG